MDTTKNKKQTLKFEVHVDEAKLILSALGKMPFEEVFELIGKLNQQANEQIGAQNPDK